PSSTRCSSRRTDRTPRTRSRHRRSWRRPPRLAKTAPVRRAFHGHLWTLGPHVLGTLRPERVPRDEPWDTTLVDPVVGPIRLTGWLRARPTSETLVIVVHGLGGDTGSRYVLRAARAADAAGLSYLRLNMRGADRSGEDLYHAGLTAD